jgi:uncharacterized protein YrrD
MKKRLESIDILVVSTEHGIIEGMLDDCLINLETKKVLGWSFRREGLFSSYGFLRKEDLIMGRDVVLTPVVHPLPKELDEWSYWGEDLIKNPIIDRQGKEISSVRDIIFDDAYSKVMGLLLEEGLVLPLSHNGDEISIRKTVVIVPLSFPLIEEEVSDKEDSWWSRLWSKRD